MDFELPRGSESRVLKTRKFRRGGHHKPSGTEIPRGWGVKIKKKTSVGGGGGGMDIFWNCTIFQMYYLASPCDQLVRVNGGIVGSSPCCAW